MDIAATPENENKPAAAPVRKPQLRWYWRVLRGFVIVYLSLLIFLYFAQKGLIFIGANTQGQPGAKIPRFVKGEVLTLKSASGETICALFGPALTKGGNPDPQARNRPTLLFFYGNAMCLSDAAQDFHDFRLLGFNVMIPEYSGFGLSSGEPSEKGCYETADAAYEYLQQRPGIDKSKIVVCGWSLGGAVAIDLASRKSVAGLMTFSAFTSMAAMGSETYPFFPKLAISLVLKHPFKSDEKIGLVKCPILIGHSRGDKIIPFEMSEQLSAAAKTKVTRLTLDGLDHAEFFSGGGDKVLNAIQSFTARVCEVNDHANVNH